MRPPKLAIRMAAGGIAVAATLALGVAGASAAPNPGPGYSGALAPATGLLPGAHDVSPNVSAVVDGPQTANVPTLAWAGEAVSLVACDTNIFPAQRRQPPHPDGGLEHGELDRRPGVTQSIPTLDGNQGDVIDSFTNGSNGFFTPNDLPENDGKGCVTADDQVDALRPLAGQAQRLPPRHKRGI